MALVSQGFTLHSWSGRHGGVTRLLRSTGQWRCISQRSRLPRLPCLAGKPQTPLLASLQRLRPSDLVSTPRPTAASTCGNLFMTTTGEAAAGQALSVINKHPLAPLQCYG